MILIPFIYLQYEIIIAVTSTVVLGLILYPVFGYFKKHKICDFIESEEEPLNVLESIKEEEEKELMSEGGDTER